MLELSSINSQHHLITCIILVLLYENISWSGEMFWALFSTVVHNLAGLFLFKFESFTVNLLQPLLLPSCLWLICVFERTDEIKLSAEYKDYQCSAFPFLFLKFVFHTSKVYSFYLIFCVGTHYLDCG